MRVFEDPQVPAVVMIDVSMGQVCAEDVPNNVLELSPLLGIRLMSGGDAHLNDPPRPCSVACRMAWEHR